jgi:uncharacterized protein YkwD
MRCPPLASPWEELLRTASAVRATPDPTSTEPSDSGRLRRAIRPIAMSAALVTAAAFALIHLAGTAGVASANSGYDYQLFSLTNHDRTSNGVRSLVYSGTLQNIGEAAPYNCNGIHIDGRSKDMITRNYFAHTIPGCGQNVFSMMQAFGVHYRSAGENIGFDAGYPNPPVYLNGAFMNSSEHRFNILNANYTEMGVGSYEGATWTGSGSALQNVWMFSEEFAQVGVSSPPASHKSSPPKPASRNSPAPAPPGVGPATTVTPLPTATPVVVPAGSLPQNLAAPPVSQYEGLFPNTVESVLEAFLTF